MDAIIEATIVDSRDIIPSLVLEAMEGEFCKHRAISSDLFCILTVKCRVEHASPSPGHVFGDALMTPDFNNFNIRVAGAR